MDKIQLVIDEIENKRKIYKECALRNENNQVLYDKAVSKEGLLFELENFIKRLYKIEEE